VIQVVVLRKIFDTKPQQFMLVMKDAMRVQNTEFGAEREIRSKLQSGEISQPEIERLFAVPEEFVSSVRSSPSGYAGH